ncbi:hypothetical protein CXG81DRAFT_3350, partial [Caulochytrium protostelioides]
DRLKHLDERMVQTIEAEIMERMDPVRWEDIAGLAHAKATIQELVVWPMLRPDIFRGVRAPAQGLLLFGPPGTGKTLLAKGVASQTGATFFSISSSSLTSKWVGDGEKLVRTLFALARVRQPAVVFIDEVDSLLSQRTDGEAEATRRIKTEFLVQFDGCGSASTDRILIIGATNRPQDIDEAARRRFRKRLYVPLPDRAARRALLDRLLDQMRHNLSDADLEVLVNATEGYGGADVDGLVREASLGPLRDVEDIQSVRADDVRPIEAHDFTDALMQVRASVTAADLDPYLQFDAAFGS